MRVIVRGIDFDKIEVLGEIGQFIEFFREFRRVKTAPPVRVRPAGRANVEIRQMDGYFFSFNLASSIINFSSSL